MMKHTDCSLSQRPALQMEKTLPEFYSTWKKGMFPFFALCSFYVSSSRIKILRSTCDGYMLGTQAYKRPVFNPKYRILSLYTHLTSIETELHCDNDRFQVKKPQLSGEYLGRARINRSYEN